MVCVRCVIHVATMVAAAPNRDPQAAAIVVMMVESMSNQVRFLGGRNPALCRCPARAVDARSVSVGAGQRAATCGRFPFGSLVPHHEIFATNLHTVIQWGRTGIYNESLCLNWLSC